MIAREIPQRRSSNAEGGCERGGEVEKAKHGARPSSDAPEDRATFPPARVAHEERVAVGVITAGEVPAAPRPVRLTDPVGAAHNLEFRVCYVLVHGGNMREAAQNRNFRPWAISPKALAPNRPRGVCTTPRAPALVSRPDLARGSRTCSRNPYLDYNPPSEVRRQWQT